MRERVQAKGMAGVAACLRCVVMGRTFTMSEVQTVLPVLESLMLRAQAAGRRAGELGAEIEDVRQRIFVMGGVQVDVGQIARWRAEQGVAMEEAKATVGEMEEIGARLHDLGEGLLDLPFRTEEGEVMLCWRLGEPAVTHWHAAGDEPGERQPLDERFGERYGRNDHERLN